MKIISVLPLKKGIPKDNLIYFTGLNIPAGNVVSVPIKNREILALVTRSEELKEKKSNIKDMNFNLRKVTKDKGSSVFLREFLDTIFETSKYFAQKDNNAVVSLIPNVFLEEYDKIKKISARGKSLPVLWHNASGGKNEKNIRAEKLLFQYPLQDRISVYRTLVRESFAKNKSIFMVMPTQFDIEKFTDQLSKGIEQFTFSLHSGISAKKILAAYEKIINSAHPVLIIGTPPFLSIPKENIGSIILEYENSDTYKMIMKPHLDLRVFVEIYASKINAKFMMADEILRLETIGRIDTDNLNPLYPLSFRINFGGEIKIENPNKKKEARLPSEGSKASFFKIFSDKTIEKIKDALENKKKVFVFTLRKGLATMTLCKDCGETISCEKCGSPLTLYSSHQDKKRMFVCNRCQVNIDGDTICAHCGSWNLLPLGIGTDTVFEEVKKLFPKNKIFQLDKKYAKTMSNAKKIIKEFNENEGSILIGTEMAFFYLKNEIQKKIPLSIIASFDSLWSIPNFKMGEKIIQIILSIIDNTKESLIIQTKNENDPAILAIKTGNLLPFAREELEDRRRLSYPPYKRFIKIKHLGDKEQTLKAKKMLEEIFKEYSPIIFSGFVPRLKPDRPSAALQQLRAGNAMRNITDRGKYVTNALIKIDPKKWSLPELSAGSSIDENLLTKLLSLPPSFEVLVDPEDLL